jgi:NADH:ubiquinone oxidoreductase subunit 6 (subunit J)
MISLYSIALVVVTLATILSRRTMYAILYLILLFALIAIFVLSLGIDFIGLIFIIVYVGAIATLFLFIIMMLGGESWSSDPALDLNSHQLLLGSGYRSSWVWNAINTGSWYLKHAALDISIVFMVGLILLEVVATDVVNHFGAWLDVSQVSYLSAMFDTSYLYGIFFYNYWYIPFLLAAVILLIAMLGSIILTTRLVLVDNDKKSTFSSKELDELPPEKPSILASRMEKYKRDEEWALHTIPLQLLWFALTFRLALWLKGPFIVSDITRWVYIGVWISIYLSGSFYIDRRSLKRK